MYTALYASPLVGIASRLHATKIFSVPVACSLAMATLSFIQEGPGFDILDDLSGMLTLQLVLFLSSPYSCA